MLDSGCATHHEKLVQPLTYLSGAEVVLFDAVGTLLEPVRSIPEIYAEVARRWGSRRCVEEIAQRWPVALKRYELRGRKPQLFGPCPLPAETFVATSETIERARWRRIVLYTVDDVIGSNADGLFHELWRYFADPDNWRLSGVLASLWDKLQAMGIRVGLASNYDQRLVELSQKLPPLNTADYVFTSAALGYPKPHPNFYREIEKRTGRSGPRLALIGDDRKSDVLVPRSRGWLSLWWDRQSQVLTGDVEGF
ncbi:MAG: hypothetical protein KatS3mg110_0422 [Pirellulaceae bacterium]|nr:MAG: hypothetical protein KatS3mg110_0422 [Pirellulaceae bacterium]